MIVSATVYLFIRHRFLLSSPHQVIYVPFPYVVMEPQHSAPEYTLELFADPSCVKEVVKGTLSHLYSPQTTKHS